MALITSGAVLAQGEGAMRSFAAARDVATAERDACAAELAEAAAALAALATAAGCDMGGGQQGSVADICRCGGKRQILIGLASAS